MLIICPGLRFVPTSVVQAAFTPDKVGRHRWGAVARSFSSSKIRLTKEHPQDSFDIPMDTETEFTSAALKYFKGDRSRKTLACLLRRPALSFSWTRWESLSQMIADKHFDPYLPLSMAPIENFRLRRSRIPTSSFDSIAHEMDLVKVQYQRDSHHPLHMGYKSYACLAPIFNHLLAKFQSLYRTTAQAYVVERTMSKFKYSYQAFLFFPIIYEEIQLPTGADIAKLDAIAEVVTDCSVLHSRNTHGPGQAGRSTIPTYAILCNPYLNQSRVPTVRFIKFEGASRSFFVGAEAGKNSQTEVYGLYQPGVDPFMFTKSLRGICDIIFDLLLLGFIDSMKASRGLRFAFGKFNYAEEDAEKWDVSINHAEIALKKFREAAEQYQNGRLGCCDDIVEEGMQALNTAVESSPGWYPRGNAMSYWNVYVDEIDRRRRSGKA